MTRSEVVRSAAGAADRRDATIRARTQGSQAALVAFLTLGALAILLPFAWMILTSFKTPAEAYTWPPVWLPAKWSVANFTQLFHTLPFARMFFNSFWTSVVIATLNIVSAAPAAYAFARLRFPGRGLWFGSHLLSLMIPWQVTIIPVFLLIRALGWYDSFTALIVPSIASGFTVFLLFQFFRSLPRSLEESVLIDGGSWFTALRHVALPAAKGAIAAAWLFSFLGNWQSFIWPLIVLQSSEKMLLPVGLLSLQNQYSVNIPVLMAGATLSTLPTVIAYLFVQRYLTDAAITSGLKG
ncbi:carbohydrate ABC transporter permease [Deinococcus sp. KSM4-11]|uniref:carbohydrate ABC transporter permease n=1 Tax=Deinococcus sp. KSM4-11 TaxID=2568654 RepID=UPI0010A50A7C|nr:carbohydrate ABC transporter permease [Deinococcus sp. KSM4-11]THF87412.1 carbohydrate ABC transporter permease [Deinococcus sp. KSM4-11]